MMYSSFMKMPVWMTAHQLSFHVFQLTINLPKSEDYGLISQLRRSANSVSANIAEGFGRNTTKDKSHFYTVAKGSAFETQNHLIYGVKVSYFAKNVAEELIQEYQELIIGLNKIMKSIKDKN